MLFDTRRKIEVLSVIKSKLSVEFFEISNFPFKFRAILKLRKFELAGVNCATITCFTTVQLSLPDYNFPRMCDVEIDLNLSLIKIYSRNFEISRDLCLDSRLKRQ